MNASLPIAALQPSSTLVNIAENAEVHLVHLLAENAPSDLISKTFAADCENMIANANAPGLLLMVLKDDGAMTALFNISPKLDECVSAFSLLASLLQRIPSDQEQSAVAAEVAEAIFQADKYDPVKRIAMLTSLYNLRVDGVERCRLLEMIIRLSSSSSQLNHLLMEGQPVGDILHAPSLQKLLEFWNVPLLERRKLYRVAAQGVASVEGSEKRKQRLLLLFLETFEQPSELDADAVDASIDATVGAIRDPVTLFVEQRSMLRTPAVLALRDSPATKPLLVLLEIFANGKLEDYERFVATYASIFDQYGLSKHECIRQMRLLSLCSLASEHEEIPYSAIASSLSIEEDEVEKWVIDAVSSGLISAKMDQLQRVVMVERCIVRSFGIEQWQALQAKLLSWKKSVKGVLDGLRQSQAVIQEGNFAT